MTDEQIIAQAEAAALQIQACIQAWEAAHPGPDIDACHKHLNLAIKHAQAATARAAKSFAGPQPADGTK